jgi:hypothetical protein
MSESLRVGSLTIELPAKDTFDKPVMRGDNMQLQDQILSMTKKNIERCYPKLLQDKDSTNEGLIFTKTYTFFEKRFARENKMIGQFTISQQYAAKDIYLLSVDKDDFNISFDLKNKDKFQLSFLPDNDNICTISRQTDDKSFEFISHKLSSNRPKLICDIEISVGTYEILPKDIREQQEQELPSKESAQDNILTAKRIGKYKTQKDYPFVERYQMMSVISCKNLSISRAVVGKSKL